MTCENCRHATVYKPHSFRVCRHARTMALQQRTNGSETGIHCEIVFREWCKGKLFEGKA